VVTEHLGDLPPDPSLPVLLELEWKGRAKGPLRVRSPPDPVFTRATLRSHRPFPPRIREQVFSEPHLCVGVPSSFSFLYVHSYAA
jgi:hypothetical protein